MTFYINSNLLACHIGFNLSSHVLKLKIIEVINYMIVVRCYEVCLLVSFLPLLIEKKKKESILWFCLAPLFHDLKLFVHMTIFFFKRAVVRYQIDFSILTSLKWVPTK